MINRFIKRRGLKGAMSNFCFILLTQTRLISDCIIVRFLSIKEWDLRLRVRTSVLLRERAKYCQSRRYRKRIDAV